MKRKIFITSEDYEERYGEEENQVIKIPKGAFCFIYPANMIDDWRTLFDVFDSPEDIEAYLEQYFMFDFCDDFKINTIFYSNCMHHCELPEFLEKYKLKIIEVDLPDVEIEEK